MIKKPLIFLMTLCFSFNAYAVSIVLGKQYLLKPKRQLSSLVWYAVTFDKSITGGLKISLKVFSEKGKSLDYLDEFRDFVSSEIAERCISKFSMSNYRMDFNEQNRTELEFQVNSIKNVIYIPLKVKYENGFEDYLVRIHIRKGKFAISTRPLQHGKLTLPEENAVENYRAEQLKEKEKLKKKEQERLAKLEAEKLRAKEKIRAEQEEKIRNAPAIDINDELFSPEAADLDKLLKDSEEKFKVKEQEAKDKVAPTSEEADLYKQPLQIPTEVLNRSTEPVNSLDSKGEKAGSSNDTGLDTLFKKGGAATKPTQLDPTNPSPTAVDGQAFDPDEFSDEEIINKPKANKNIEQEAAFGDDDNEIIIEGFDEALQEIERLEGLED